MEFDLKKNYEFETSIVPFLINKLGYLMQLKDYRIEKMDNQKVLRLLLKKTAQKGFLRTHIFFINWFRELFEQGDLSRKSLQEIESELPWSYDQTKKYCDALEENGLLMYSRDTKGRKICILTVEDILADNTAEIPLQSRRLFNYFKYRKKLSTNHLSELKEVMTNYYKKVTKLETMRGKIEKNKKRIRPADQKLIEQLVKELVSLFWQSKKENEIDIVENIEAVLGKKPSLVFSLHYRER